MYDLSMELTMLLWAVSFYSWCAPGSAFVLLEEVDKFLVDVRLFF